MEFVLLVVSLLFVASVSYGFDYIFNLKFFKDMDEIERALG